MMFTLTAAPPATGSQSATRPVAKDPGAPDQSGKHNHSLNVDLANWSNQTF